MSLIRFVPRYLQLLSPFEEGMMRLNHFEKKKNKKRNEKTKKIKREKEKESNRTNRPINEGDIRMDGRTGGGVGREGIIVVRTTC